MSGRRGLAALLPAGKCRPGPGSFPVSLSLASGCSAGCEVLAGEVCRAGALRAEVVSGGGQRGHTAWTMQTGRCGDRTQLHWFSEDPSCNVPLRARVSLLTQGALSCGVRIADTLPSTANVTFVN